MTRIAERILDSVPLRIITAVVLIIVAYVIMTTGNDFVERMNAHNQSTAVMCIAPIEQWQNGCGGYNQ